MSLPSVDNQGCRFLAFGLCCLPFGISATSQALAGHLLVSRPNDCSVFTLILAALSSGILGFCAGALVTIRDGFGPLVDRRDQAGFGAIARGKLFAAIGILLTLSMVALILASEDKLCQNLILWGATLAFILIYSFVARMSVLAGLIQGCAFALGVSSHGRYEGEYWWYLPAAAAPIVVYVVFQDSLSGLEISSNRKGLLIRITGMIFAALMGATWLPIWYIVADEYLTSRAFEPSLVSKTVQSLLETWAVPYPAILVSFLLVGWIIWRVRRIRDLSGVCQFRRDGLISIILLDSAFVSSDTACVFQGLVLSFLFIPAAVLSLWGRSVQIAPEVAQDKG